MILITGSNGFLGSHVCKLFDNTYEHTHRAYDLTRPDHIWNMFYLVGTPDTIIHLAADVGGLTYNLNNPATIYYNNVAMNTLLIHHAATHNVKRFIFISSVCAYPHHSYIPTKEHHLWDGYPESSNAAYGISKRIALTQLQACKESYGMDYEYLILSNLYGPGDRSNHVIPDLIRKFKASQDPIEVWGDGSQTRDFLFVRDAANAISYFEAHPLGEPVNIASGLPVTVRQVVDLLSEFSGYQGTIVYNYDKPFGEQRRGYNTDLARSHGFEVATNFKEGLKEAWHASPSNDL